MARNRSGGGRQPAELGKVFVRKRHLRHLFHAADAELPQRLAALARDPDADGGGADGVAQRPAFAGPIPRAIPHGFEQPVAQRQFGNKRRRRYFRRPHRPPDEGNVQPAQAAGGPVTTIGHMMREAEADSPVEFAHDADEFFLPEMIVDGFQRSASAHPAECRREFEKNGMEVGQWIFCQPRFGQYTMLVAIRDDGPDFVFPQGFMDDPPGIAGFGSLAGETGVG